MSRAVFSSQIWYEHQLTLTSKRERVCLRHHFSLDGSFCFDLDLKLPSPSWFRQKSIVHRKSKGSQARPSPPGRSRIICRLHAVDRHFVARRPRPLE